MNYLLILIQSIFLIFITPLFIGILKRFKASIRGYQGSSIFQPYYDIKKLLYKEMVISNSSSFITLIGPSICLAFAIGVSFLTPVFYTTDKYNLGNIFLVIFMISVIKIITALIGLDCASTFGGMGSSRECFISIFAEPITLIIFSTLYFETNSFDIYKISYEAINKNIISVSHLLAMFAFFALILAENARMPIDNPETHLELTMIHEAMILDVSGRNLLFIELASSIKLVVFITLLINLFFPFGITASLKLSSIIISAVLYIIKVILILLVISIIETTIAKFRLFRVPEIIASSFALALISIAMLYFKI